LKGKELYVLKPLIERFRFPLPESTPLFDFIVAHEASKRTSGWEFGAEAEDSGWVKIFRLVVILYRPIWLSA